MKSLEEAEPEVAVVLVAEAEVLVVAATEANLPNSVVYSLGGVPVGLCVKHMVIIPELVRVAR